MELVKGLEILEVNIIQKETSLRKKAISFIMIGIEMEVQIMLKLSLALMNHLKPSPQLAVIQKVIAAARKASDDIPIIHLLRVILLVLKDRIIVFQIIILL